jgi:hypothetical protein
MINKKMVLSILIIACVGVATAGTWANYVVQNEVKNNKLTAGTIELTFDSQANVPFDVKYIIPGQDDQQIKRKICVWIFDKWVDYTLMPKNTGNIAGDLYISGEEVAELQSLSNNVHIYYATSDDVSKAVEITGTPTFTGVKLEPNHSATLYFWYSYDNVESSIQNLEMGKTLTENLKFELRNPDSITGEPIY